MWKYCVIRVRKPLRNKHELISALLTDSPLPSDYKSGENYCYELLYSAPEQSESFSMGEKYEISEIFNPIRDSFTNMIIKYPKDQFEVFVEGLDLHYVYDYKHGGYIIYSKK